MKYKPVALWIGPDGYVCLNFFEPFSTENDAPAVARQLFRYITVAGRGQFRTFGGDPTQLKKKK